MIHCNEKKTQGYKELTRFFGHAFTISPNSISNTWKIRDHYHLLVNEGLIQNSIHVAVNENESSWKIKYDLFHNYTYFSNIF